MKMLFTFFLILGVGGTLPLHAQKDTAKVKTFGLQNDSRSHNLPSMHSCTVDTEFSEIIITKIERDGHQTNVPLRGKRTTIYLNDCGKGPHQKCYYRLRVITKDKGYSEIEVQGGCRYGLYYTPSRGYYFILLAGR